METLHAQVAEPAYEITPLLVIFYALVYLSKRNVQNKYTL